MKEMTVCMALAALLCACGGGGGGSDNNAKPEPAAQNTATPPKTDPVAGTPPVTTPVTTPPQPEAPFTVLGDQSLPGRIVVSAAAYDSEVYDLQTGIGTNLPAPKEAREHSYWVGTDSSPYIIQTGGAPGLHIYKTSDLTTRLRTVKLPGSNLVMGVSPNGQYILAFQHDGAYDQLTVYDATTGAVIKQRSYIGDQELVIGAPAAWMPDNHYLYFHKAKLYIASPDTFDDTVLFDLAGQLPYNSTWDGGAYMTNSAKLAVNPQGTKLAFVWEEKHQYVMDAHIWILDVDGNLHRLTDTATPQDSSSFIATGPTWSPDGQWIIGVLPVGGVGIAPIYPNPEDTVNPAWGIISVSGCDSQIFALPASSHDVPLDRYKINPKATLKVRTADGKKARWLTECPTPGLYWLGN